jgi:hypothetical protein
MPTIDKTDFRLIVDAITEQRRRETPFNVVLRAAAGGRTSADPTLTGNSARPVVDIVR